MMTRTRLATLALLALAATPLAHADPVTVDVDGRDGHQWAVVRVRDCPAVAGCQYAEAAVMTYALVSYAGAGVCYAPNVDYCPGYLVFVDTQNRFPVVTVATDEDGDQAVVYRSCDMWGFPYVTGPTRCHDTVLLPLP